MAEGAVIMQRRRFGAFVAATVVVGSLAVTGTVAAVGNGVKIDAEAELSCPGGIVRLGHVLDESAVIFPGDPVPSIEQVATIPEDGFLVEEVSIGTHTGTHLSAPGHFIEGAPTVDDLAGSDFVWPAYVIDVRQRVAADPNFQLSVADLRAFERREGRIPRGALVILFTGFQDRWPTEAYFDTAPGFSTEAISWMFATRRIKGVGTDTFGPDASSDTDFLASFTTYELGGVTIENMTGLDQLHNKGDIVIASVTRLRDGSGYQTDPLGCLGDRDDD
jgi:kynurenine formamidase